MATAQSESYEMLQNMATPASESNYMRDIRESDYLQVVDEPDLLQEFSHIQVIDEPDYLQVIDEASYLQAVHEPDYLQVVDEPEQVVGAAATILGEYVSGVDKNGYLLPVNSNGYLKPVDIMRNSEQHYQKVTTGTAYQDRQYDSLNQTADNKNKAISVGDIFKPHNLRNTSLTCSSAVFGGLYDAESSATASAQGVIYSQSETPADSAQHAGEYNEVTTSDYNEVADAECNELAEAEYNDVTDAEYNDVTENNNSVKALNNKLQPPCLKRGLAW